MWREAIEFVQDGTLGRTYKSAPTVRGILFQQLHITTYGSPINSITVSA